MKINVSDNATTALIWAGLSAAVIYAVKKTGRLTPFFAFVFAPMPIIHSSAIKEVTNGTD